MGGLIGARLPRLEDQPLLIGKGRFIDDIASPGVLHAAFVGFLLVAITVAFGVFVYGAHFPALPDLLLFIVTLMVGAACFAAVWAAQGRPRRRAVAGSADPVSGSP